MVESARKEIWIGCFGRARLYVGGRQWELVRTTWKERVMINYSLPPRTPGHRRTESRRERAEEAGPRSSPTIIDYSDTLHPSTLAEIHVDIL